ncbi:FeoC-like transcriptional regulator [Galenea microaerophila]
MILREIKHYIQEQGQVSLEDIINHFDLTEPGAEAMLERLVQQGYVLPLPQTESSCQTGSCGGCTQAGGGSPRFQWIPRKVKPLPFQIQS